MKKLISLFLVAVMCLSLVACNGGDKKALELSASAFNYIHQAYEKIEVIGNDILTVWKLGIYNESELRTWQSGFALICNNVSLSRDDMLDGLAYLEFTTGDSYSTYEKCKEAAREHYDLYFYSSATSSGLLARYNNTFSACIDLVVESYRQNGMLAEIEGLLSSAIEIIKELSYNHSDYEHYENVKKYFTAVNTYFNFCSNPSGTLEQVMENTNKYNNTADECYNSLYYFFEE